MHFVDAFSGPSHRQGHNLIQYGLLQMDIPAYLLILVPTIIRAHIKLRLETSVPLRSIEMIFFYKWTVYSLANGYR